MVIVLNIYAAYDKLYLSLVYGFNGCEKRVKELEFILQFFPRVLCVYRSLNRKGFLNPTPASRSRQVSSLRGFL